nr:LicD family protein [uncultured Butyrivibrio sp.]
MPKLSFPDNYFNNETRCNFHISGMMKRLWASQMEILYYIDQVCRENNLKYIMCFGSLLGTVRHKGFIPWDDDIDIAMLRGDYERFLEAINGRLPQFFETQSLLPGAIPPKEMIFNIGNGKRLDTSPQFLDRFHGCPYSTGVDIFVFDRIPDNPEDYAYQDRLIRMLDRILMLQWKVDDGSIPEDELREYRAIEKTLGNELDFSFIETEPKTTQILRLLDMACSLCEDCGSHRVENREQMLYYGDRGFKEEHFTDRILVPFEGVMNVPIPKDYEEILKRIFGEYYLPVKYGSQHNYPIYKYQREALYKAYKERGWKIPEEFLEYDEEGKLILDPALV